MKPPAEPPPVMGAPQEPEGGVLQEVVGAAKDKLQEKAADAAWSWLVTTLWPFVFGATAGAITGAGAGAVMAHVIDARKGDAASMTVMVAQAADGGVPPLAGMGVVTVFSVPPRGRVTLDGRLVGATPIQRLDVLPGTHAVVVEEDGYVPFTGSVTVAPGGRAPVLATLQLPTAQAAADGGAGRGARRGGGYRGGGYVPPPRDCYGERDHCRSRCGDSETHCSMSCFGCGSCTTDLTSEQCQERCRQCRDGCTQNEQFCNDQCDSARDACQSG